MMPLTPQNVTIAKLFFPGTGEKDQIYDNTAFVHARLSKTWNTFFLIGPCTKRCNFPTSKMECSFHHFFKENAQS